MIDEFTKESLHIDVAGSIRSKRLIQILEQLIEDRGCPLMLRSDTGRRTSAAQFSYGQKRLALHFNISSQASHSKMRMWKDSTEQSAMNGSANTTGQIWMKSGTSLPNGYGFTIMNVQTWHWTDLHRNSGWPWPLSSTSKSP